MTFIHQAILMATILVASSALYQIRKWQHSTARKHSSNIYHSVAFSVLGLASLLLAWFGWGILGIMGDGASNKLVAIISSLIPFSWAIGLISRFYPKAEKIFFGILLFGLILITGTRFMDLPLMSRIVYPVFHSTAAIVVISIPVISYIKGLVKLPYLWVSVGGALISMGGISLAFLSAGKQLLFFSTDFVLLIFAPLLFVTTATYLWGLTLGEKDEGSARS